MYAGTLRARQVGNPSVPPRSNHCRGAEEGESGQSKSLYNILLQFRLVTVARGVDGVLGSSLQQGAKASVKLQRARSNITALLARLRRTLSFIGTVRHVSAKENNKSPFLFFVVKLTTTSTTVLDFPQYDLHARMLADPSLALHNKDGARANMSGGGHGDMGVFDFSNPETRNIFAQTCIDATKTGQCALRL